MPALKAVNFVVAESIVPFLAYSGHNVGLSNVWFQMIRDKNTRADFYELYSLHYSQKGDDVGCMQFGSL